VVVPIEPCGGPISGYPKDGAQSVTSLNGRRTIFRFLTSAGERLALSCIGNVPAILKDDYLLLYGRP